MWTGLNVYRKHGAHFSCTWVKSTSLTAVSVRLSCWWERMTLTFQYKTKRVRVRVCSRCYTRFWNVYLRSFVYLLCVSYKKVLTIERNVSDTIKLTQKKWISSIWFDKSIDWSANFIENQQFISKNECRNVNKSPESVCGRQHCWGNYDYDICSCIEDKNLFLCSLITFYLFYFHFFIAFLLPNLFFRTPKIVHTVCRRVCRRNCDIFTWA